MSAFSVCTVPHSAQPACAQPLCSGQFFKGLGYRVHFAFLDAFFAEQDATQALTLSLESSERYYSVTRTTVISLKALRGCHYTRPGTWTTPAVVLTLLFVIRQVPTHKKYGNECGFWLCFTCTSSCLWAPLIFSLRRLCRWLHSLGYLLQTLLSQVEKS